MKRHTLSPPHDSLVAIADPEYQTRIEAERVTAQFKNPITPRFAQHAIEDLPLFGGERQQNMFPPEVDQ